MRKLSFIICLFISIVFLNINCIGEKGESWPPVLKHNKIAVTLGGWHSTTRGTIRLIFPVDGKWLVFRGDPNTYHFSDDGMHWTSIEA